MTTHITEAQLDDLVHRFYGKARQDSLIGPLFNSAVDDWPRHLEKLGRFWSSVMLRTGRYKGNPVAEHLKHAERITPAMFDRWLDLWRETTAELLPAETAGDLQEKAGRIGESLQLALRFHRGETTLAARPAASGTPYRSTPVFDETTLPDALRREHRTRAGTWGVIRVLSGELRLHFEDDAEPRLLTEDRPGVVAPEQTHWVEPVGPVTLRVDFHHAPPAL
ncbi:MAG: DUF1971 domain-containing protein [Porphyrobacter sp.]|nr:DUF1971 domain-containing protein [Porphyrobacter sp.]